MNISLKWIYNPVCWKFLDESGLVMWVMSQCCGCWCPGALAPGHQQHQYWWTINMPARVSWWRVNPNLSTQEWLGLLSKLIHQCIFNDQKIFIFIESISIFALKHPIDQSILIGVMILSPKVSNVSCWQNSSSLHWGNHVICWPAYVIMIVADALVPNRQRAISNHHADSTGLHHHDSCRCPGAK